MAYKNPRELDGFLPHLAKPDNKLRLQVGADLLSYLAEPSNPTACQDIGQLVDDMVLWMQSSNYRISSNGIEVMIYLVDRLGNNFRPYLTILPCVVDRLGDARDTVREKAQLLILKLLEREVLTPQSLLERLTPGFTHKNAKIREEVCRCLVNILNEHGAQSVTLRGFVPHIVKLLSDPTSPVRETAFSTLVELYKHVGDKLIKHIQKRNLVPQQKLTVLMNRFEETKQAGELLPTAASLDLDDIEPPVAVTRLPSISAKKVPSAASSIGDFDELDRAVSLSKMSAPAKKIVGPSPSMKRTPSTTLRAPSSVGAGGLDEDIFIKQFEDVPTIQIYSPREVTEIMKTIQDTISDTNKDWNKRTEALKKLRSLIVAGANSFDDFLVNLRNLEIPLQNSIKDLRSQVVREACITIAYMSQVLGSKFDHAAEALLNPLLNLIQNSAKIIATAGLTCVRFIVRNTQGARLIPIITANLQNSKSKEIRRSCCELLEYILSAWPTHPLERHIAILQDAVKRGIADADSEARVIARRAFRGFKDHFPEQAEALLQSLEPSYRKALQGELCVSSSSSSGSLAQIGTFRPRQLSAQSAAGAAKNKRRSNSAIDLQAAQRAKARGQYSALSRQQVMSGTASLQVEVAQQARPRKTPEVAPASSAQLPERMGRSTRRKNVGVSHSQPTSRSASPSSRLPYYYGRTHTVDSDSPRPRRLSSGTPRSTAGSRDTSRETSPTRGIGLSRFRRNSDRPPLSPAARPVMAQRILQQSREAESALASALSCDQADGDYHRMGSPRKTMRSIDNHSDDSETSSICSERSFDSYRRPSDSYSWSGSQQRLSSRDMWEPCRDINEIIALCASTVWQERKDGLVSLRLYLSAGNLLSPGELKHITEICTKMFVDSHTKGLSVVLDTVNEIIRRHKADLYDWLYILLQKIFYKSGTDLLVSAQNKLAQTLENVKRSFPVQLQFGCIYKFLVDVAQTPRTKVKVEVLNYLSDLCQLADPGQFVTDPPAQQALQKIINYSQDAKSTDIRTAAKKCVVSMWNCNTPQVTMMLSDLPKEHQDVASHIVQNHMRKNSTGSDTGCPSGGGSPKPLSPLGTPTCGGNDLNREEIYKSLKRTTAEIQNYSYESLGSKLDRERDTTSHDSGISQMSLGNDNKNDIIILEETMDELTIRPSYMARLNFSVNGVADNNSNGCGHDNSTEEEIVMKVLECCTIDYPLPHFEKCKLLRRLGDIVKHGNVEPIVQNFKKLLRLFIDTLSQNDPKSQVTVLEVFAEIFKNKELEQSWSNFIELLTLKVLDCYSDSQRDVVKAAEITTLAMGVFPFNNIVNMLSPLIQTNPYPKLDGAIKMLTKLVDMHLDEVTDEHLQAIMPGLIKANDHEQSSARKSAVFCMVAIHKAVGEERLAPHIASLSGSKLKLLRLYIEKEQNKTPAAKGGSRLNTS